MTLPTQAQVEAMADDLEAAVAMLRALAPLAPADAPAPPPPPPAPDPPVQPPPVAAAPPTMSAQAQATAIIELADYLLVSSDGWVMQSPFRESDVCDMRFDGLSGFWIWTNTGARTIDDLIKTGGLHGLAVNYYAPAYDGLMIGVQRNADSGKLYGYSNPGKFPSEGYASFPPNTMPLSMNLPILRPSQMATTTVTPGAVQAFPWEQVVEWEMSPVNCAIQSQSNLWTRNSVYLVADLPIGGTVGTPPLTLILETEQTAADPNLGGGAMRLERYAFAKGFGLVWQEQAWDPRTPDANGVRSIWNIKVPNDRGHLVGPLCPILP